MIRIKRQRIQTKECKHGIQQQHFIHFFKTCFSVLYVADLSVLVFDLVYGVALFTFGLCVCFAD